MGAAIESSTHLNWHLPISGLSVDCFFVGETRKNQKGFSVGVPQLLALHMCVQESERAREREKRKT